MEIKRYRAPNVSDGVAWARQELGPEAVLLSTRQVHRKAWLPWIGGREIEITAGVPSEVSASRHQTARSSAGPGVDPSVTELVARLRAGHIDEDLAFEIASGIPPVRRRGLDYAALVKMLAARFAPLVAVDLQQRPVEVFVGPPGTGKTTTVAKIAAQTRARAGVSVELIAADGFRVGAAEQLRLYADIIGTPFTVATTPGDLELAIGARQQPVLIDTAGRPPQDQAMRDLFGVFSSRSEVRVHLVLDAGQSPQQLSSAVTAYRDTRPDRIIVTKLDQVGSLGPMLRMLRETRIPVSYLCTGQTIPDDLCIATPELFAVAVLGELPESGGRDESTS